MKFSEKIDFLMKITEISNSVLGKELSFDASYISRIRGGKRNPPKNQPFTEPAAKFFAEHINDEYQKKMASEIILAGNDWPENKMASKKVILQWLSMPDNAENIPVGKLLSGIAGIKPAAIPNVEIPVAPQTQNLSDTQFFYGNEGKRQAVALFLGELSRMENPPQLLLYSNEDFSWMYEDPEFSKKWAMLLFAYIKKGGRIKIAHTISRASGEMLVALQKWIPVYMTGAIEPYYYPKILDRVFRKTMFIAEGYSAISASSVGDETENALNMLIHNKSAVKSLENEYWSFFGLCKPLMQIFNVAGKEKFLDVLQKFNSETESMITVRTTPSFYTMPNSVAKSMTERLNSGWIIKRQQIGNETFLKMMDEGKSLTELLNLPAAEEIEEGRVPFPMCDLFDKPGLLYNKEEFAAHLESVIEKLELYENYNVLLSSAIPKNEIVYVKEDVGVILVKNDIPTIAFAINEQRMVSAFWDYLGELSENGKSKEKTLAYLKKLLESLK